MNKVKDQVRKRQKRMSNVADSGEEHSIIWGMFMAATMNAATFMGKNFMDNENSIKNSTDLTLKKIFDITEKLVSEQEEINNLDKIFWKNHSWKQLSLIGDETVINLQRAKVYVFSDSVLCLGKVHQHPESNEAWKKRIEWIITEKSYRDFDGINGEPTEFEWNIFPGFTALQLCGKVTDLLRLGEEPETFTGRILFLSMFNDISCDRKGDKEECLANARVVKALAIKFGVGQWSFIGPGSEKKWYSIMEDPVVPLERNLYGHPLAGLLWERQFEKILLKHGWETVSKWVCLFVHREKGLFLSVYVDDTKLAGKKQNINPMWKCAPLPPPLPSPLGPWV